jgi:hypothetical protein
MAKYRAVVVIDLDPFDAGSDTEAEEVVSAAIEKLAAADLSPVGWTSCDWQLVEVVDEK